MRLLIDNARIWDGTGKAPFPGKVLVEDERIAAVAPQAEALVGGDYSFAANPRGRNARDLELFVQHFGFSPSEVLQAATRLGGEAMMRPDEIGLVKQGYLADLLLVDGDPLADVKVLQDKKRFAFIMKDGVRYVPCEGVPHVRRLQ